MLWLLLVGCAPADFPAQHSTPTDPSEPSDPADPADPTDPTSADVEAMKQLPVLFIHGITGEAANFEVPIQHLVEQGWDETLLFAQTFEDPEWGCNVDNAHTIEGWVSAIRTQTGTETVQLVAHSMGTLSSRYYMKNLGGGDAVHNYVTLGGMHHGLQSSCSPDFPFKPCIWDEICTNGDFVAQLNEAPVMPGSAHYVSIYGTADETVPNWSSELDGAVNLSLDGVEHFGPNGVLEHPEALAELVRSLLWE